VTRRTDRIGELLREELARLLRDETSDPRIGMVTLTRVDVSPDLAQALVFWSALVPRAGQLDEEAVATIGDGLQSAATFLRRRVAKELEIRRSPALEFRYDASLEIGAQTLELLREVRAERPAPGESGEDDEGSDGV
jgi:ribosome-binding factor A